MLKKVECVSQGSSLNDVTALGGGGIVDFLITVIKIVIKKHVDGERGYQKKTKLRDDTPAYQ